MIDEKEPSKMLPDEKPPIAENETEAAAQAAARQDAPLTKEEFSAQMQRLTERARAAGLNPIRVMVQTYVRQGMAMLDGFLTALENEDSSKKKGK